MHFFEAIKRNINFKYEYLKLENIIICESRQTDYGHYRSINSWIEEQFRCWKKRDTFLSFNELRSHLGFITVDRRGVMEDSSIPETVSMEQYFLYCEIIINLAHDLKGANSTYLSNIFEVIFETMRLNIERSGFEVKKVKEGYIVAEKSAASIEGADLMPDIADVIVEYNHYILKGDLTRKKELLKKIADALEPERDSLEATCPKETRDFFYMVNNMNVRHNNCDPKDEKRYREVFATLSKKEKEAWYDKIYEQALSIIIIREQKTRTVEIELYKNQK